MRHLLDASSLALLIKKADVGKAIEVLQDSSILALTYYELGNAIWKESTITKFLTAKEADSLGMVAKDVISRVSRMDNEADAFPEILRMARKERLSFYDSSYVLTAKDKGLELITEDRRLREKARNYVDVRAIESLLT